jgi:uncharacterized protein YigE (DUF2233 family)
MKHASLRFRSMNRAKVCRLVAIECLFLTLLSACSGAKKHFDLGYSHIVFGDVSADVYVVDTRRSHIQIVGRNAPLSHSGTLIELDRLLTGQGVKLLFATNGGMYQPNFDPVGLLVQNGDQVNPINLSQGEGNFFLLPNGVFLVTADGKVAVVRSDKFARSGVEVTEATQSGPLLVIDKKINPAFKPGSQNRLVRSGVGVINEHTVVFALSSGPVNFWDFAKLFKNEFGCKNALYLDGVISKFYIPGKRRASNDDQYGVLIGVTQ